jgi:hypothetical protein
MCLNAEKDVGYLECGAEGAAGPAVGAYKPTDPDLNAARRSMDSGTASEELAILTKVIMKTEK